MLILEVSSFKVQEMCKSLGLEWPCPQISLFTKKVLRSGMNTYSSPYLCAYFSISM